jgi:glycosyltransferase involved in cell wall biosynthesis
MGKSRVCSGVVFVGPGRRSQGGIAAVIGNYRKTSFWKEFDCSHFASTEDHRSRIAKIASDFWRLSRFASAIIFSTKPCAISIHSADKGSFYRKLAYLVIARFFRIPAILHIHPAAFADFYKHGNYVRRSAVRFAGRLSDQIIFLSDKTMSDLVDVFEPSKLSVLGNPVDINSYVCDRPGCSFYIRWKQRS